MLTCDDNVLLAAWTTVPIISFSFAKTATKKREKKRPKNLEFPVNLSFLFKNIEYLIYDRNQNYVREFQNDTVIF